MSAVMWSETTERPSDIFSLINPRLLCAADFVKGANERDVNECDRLVQPMLPHSNPLSHLNRLKRDEIVSDTVKFMEL